jgi:hypothetical protein
VKASVAEIATLEGLLREHVAAAVVWLKNQVGVEAAAEANLQQLLEIEQEKVKALDGYLLQDDMIRAEIARTEALYNGTLAQLTDVRLVDQALAEGGMSVVVRDLQGPDLQAELVWPKPIELLAICGVCGLIGGVFLAYGSELAQRAGKPPVPDAH